MILGGMVSLAANVAHSLLRPDPPVGAIIASVLWPVLVFTTTEIILRNSFHGARSMLAWAGLTPVALLAAVASYQHLSGLLTHYGETRFVALGGPLAVDGLMVLSTGLLFVSKAVTPVYVTSPVDYEDDVDDADDDVDHVDHDPYPQVRALRPVSTTRAKQIHLIRTQVPNRVDREHLTWDQIGDIVGVRGRASIQRIRAALTTADQNLNERAAI